MPVVMEELEMVVSTKVVVEPGLLPEAEELEAQLG